MTTKTRTYQVMFGPKDTPMETWEVYRANLNDDPAYIQEHYVRRPNWDNDYYAKKYEEPSRNEKRYMMRQTPPDQDYITRMENRTDDPVWFEKHMTSSYQYPELIDGKVHYYASIDDAVKDKRSNLSAARFLRTVIGHSEYRVAEILESYGVPYNTDCELRFATTAEDVQRVYANGPTSCMSGNDRYRQAEVAVYAQHPFAVAYLVRVGDDSDDDHIIARTVVHLEKKRWVRTYGATIQIEHELCKLEYRRAGDDTFDGIIVTTTGDIGLPYFDFNHYNTIRNPQNHNQWLIQTSHYTPDWDKRDATTGELLPEPEPVVEPIVETSGENLGDILSAALRERRTETLWYGNDIRF